MKDLSEHKFWQLVPRTGGRNSPGTLMLLVRQQMTYEVKRGGEGVGGKLWMTTEELGNGRRRRHGHLDERTESTLQLWLHVIG